MLAGLIAGTITTVASNPIWVVQTTQATHSMSPSEHEGVASTKRGIVDTIQSIIRTGGVQALWRGVGPALILVINPILQYTCFEQLKNMIIRRRWRKTRSATLSDLDVLFISAIAKLVATSITYPYVYFPCYTSLVIQPNAFPLVPDCVEIPCSGGAHQCHRFRVSHCLSHGHPSCRRACWFLQGYREQASPVGSHRELSICVAKTPISSG